MGLLDTLTMKGLPPPWRAIGLALLGGVVGGGIYVGHISNALSYLSDDPAACVNCHIMRPEYATWQHSSHGRGTTCNDCHVPHDSVLKKYAFKASDGMRHSALFTLHMERQVIEARPESREVIQQNCVRCHGNLLSEVKSFKHDFDRSCTDCHREVPHGRVHSLSTTPNAAVPQLSPVTPDWMRSTPTSTKP